MKYIIEFERQRILTRDLNGVVEDGAADSNVDYIYSNLNVYPETEDK